MVPSLWWTQVVLGGKRLGPALPATTVTVHGTCSPGKFPLWASTSPSGDADRSPDNPQGLASLVLDSLIGSALVATELMGLFLTSLDVEGLILSWERAFWKWVLLPPRSLSTTVRLLPLPLHDAVLTKVISDFHVAKFSQHFSPSLT